MTGQERNKSFAFVTLYLSGLSKAELANYAHFNSEMENSEDFELLSEVENALTLHHLSSLRRHIYQNYKSYREVKTPESAVFLLPDTSYLKDNKILDAYGIFTRNYEIQDLFNAITVEIDKIVEGVLKGFDFPYIDEIKAFFYFPKKMTLKDLADYNSRAAKIKKSAHFDVPIFRISKIERYLQSIFFLDNSVIITGHVLTGKPYKMVTIAEELDGRTVDWGHLRTLREQRLEAEKQSILLQEEKIKQEQLAQEELQKEKERELEAKKAEEQATILANESAKAVTPTATAVRPVLSANPPLMRPDRNYIPVTTTGVDVETILYVDCDNINVFNFLSILEDSEMMKTSASTIIKLYIDTKANPIWRVIENFISDKYTVLSIPVSRIKQEKSVVDIILASEISKDYSLGYGKSHVIVSSDSDFYGILESGIEATVMYEESTVSNYYLGYLSKEGVMAQDISKNYSSSRNVKYKKKIIMYLGLISCTEIPLAELNLETLTASMKDKYTELERNYAEKVTGNFIELVAKEVLQGYQVVTTPNGYEASVDTVSYVVPFKD